MSKVPLKRLHSDETTEASSSYHYWRGQSTSKIVTSLLPTAEEPLTVKEDGTVMQGNTRVKVLEERGYGVDDLPRAPYHSQSFNWEDGG
jgi:hypothetical protein